MLLSRCSTEDSVSLNVDWKIRQKQRSAKQGISETSNRNLEWKHNLILDISPSSPASLAPSTKQQTILMLHSFPSAISFHQFNVTPQCLPLVSCSWVVHHLNIPVKQKNYLCMTYKLPKSVRGYCNTICCNGQAKTMWMVRLIIWIYSLNLFEVCHTLVGYRDLWKQSQWLNDLSNYPHALSVQITVLTNHISYFQSCDLEASEATHCSGRSSGMSGFVSKCIFILASSCGSGLCHHKVSPLERSMSHMCHQNVNIRQEYVPYVSSKCQH